VRVANRSRELLRPQAPADLQFTLEEDKLPSDFLVKDVSVGDQRHLLFATANQLQLLGLAQRWYIDGTFWIVRPPFTQLLSVHAFIANGGN